MWPAQRKGGVRLEREEEKEKETEEREGRREENRKRMMILCTPILHLLLIIIKGLSECHKMKKHVLSFGSVLKTKVEN